MTTLSVLPGRHRLSIVGAAVLAVLVPPAATAADTTLEEVVVTAQKRQQPINEVPISMSALTGSNLEDLNADDFGGYVDFVPGAYFESRSPGENRFTIRGMGVPVATSASTTAIYIDEVPITDLLRIPELRTFDVNRVEILRGPQGTLYGEGAMGGAVKILYNQPAKEFNAAAEVTGEDTSGGGFGYGANAMLNVPLGTDKVVLRVVGYKRDLDGYIDEISTGEDNHNWQHIEGGRAALRFQMSEAVDLTLTGTYEKTDLGGFFKHAPTTAGDLRISTNGVDEYAHDKFHSYSAVLNWEFDAATLTLVGSKYDYESRTLENLAGYFAPEHHAKHGEMRLASSNDGALSWIAGLFYKDFESQSSYASGSYNFLDKQQKAVFADATWKFSDTWSLTGGLRYAEEDAHGGFYSKGAGRNLTDDTISDNAVTWRLVASYQPADQQLYYASIAKGFRSAGVNVFAALFGSTLTTFESDNAINYELGAKISTSDRALTASVAAYYTDWRDIQTPDDPPGSGFIIVNGDGATVYGIEGDLTWNPAVKGLMFAVTGSWIHTEYNSAITGATPPIPKGERLNAVPKWTASAIGEYAFPVTDSLEGFVRLEQTARSDVIDVSRKEIPPANQTNLRVGLKAAQHWDVTLWMENLSNGRDVQAWDTFSINPVPVRPRTIGLTFRWNYQ